MVKRSLIMVMVLMLLLVPVLLSGCFGVDSGASVAQDEQAALNAANSCFQALVRGDLSTFLSLVTTDFTLTTLYNLADWTGASALTITYDQLVNAPGGSLAPGPVPTWVNQPQVVLSSNAATADITGVKSTESSSVTHLGSSTINGSAYYQNNLSFHLLKVGSSWKVQRMVITAEPPHSYDPPILTFSAWFVPSSPYSVGDVPMPLINLTNAGGSGYIKIEETTIRNGITLSTKQIQSGSLTMVGSQESLTEFPGGDISADTSQTGNYQIDLDLYYSLDGSTYTFVTEQIISYFVN